MGSEGMASVAPPRLRTGLVVLPDGETGRGRIVKDPRARRYFRFGEIEGAILELLDGEHSPVDIQVQLAVRFGEELALDELEEFLDTLREKGLVEDEGDVRLPALAPALGARVLATLERGGFHVRRATDPLPPGMSRDERRQREAEKFDEAVDLLRQGRFRAALRALDEILVENPSNQRAAALRGVLVQAGTRAAAEEAKRQRRPRRRRSLLYFQVPLFDPDRLFARLEPALRFLWTPGFVAAYLAALASAGWIAVTHRAELLAHLPHLAAGGWLGGFILAAIVLTALHEFAHGLTCKHYGGRVPELGFLLIFFIMPALYVDVSDAWLFRRRRHRVLVGLAGPMFDLGVAVAALHLWRFLAPGTGKVLAFVAAAASGAGVLMNLNPLLRLDGYYVLSDLSGIPNLRSTALGAVARGIGRLFGRRGEAPALPARARFFLGIYGVLSTIYILGIFALLGHLALNLSTAVAGLWGPVALVLVLGWLGRRLFLGLGRALLRALSRLTPARMLTVGAAVVVAGILLAVPRPLRVGGQVVLEAGSRVAVRPEVAGNLAEVLVREGDRVEAGQVVARLDRSDLLAQLAMTRSEVERARADLSLLLDGPEKERVRQAREKVRAARAEVEHLRARHERLGRLRKEGLVPADLYEQVTKELKIKEGVLRAALDEARLLERGARPERIAAARAEVSRLEARAADILRRLAACDLRAPAGGVVVTPRPDGKLGERIPAGGLVLEIADLRNLVAEAVIPESEIGDVHPGLPVEVRLSAWPTRTFSGKVLEIAPRAETDSLGRAVFRVRCSVENPDGKLRPGMTGAIKIECGRRPLGALAWRRVLRLVDPSLL